MSTLCTERTPWTFKLLIHLEVSNELSSVKHKNINSLIKEINVITDSGTFITLILSRELILSARCSIYHVTPSGA